MSVALGKKIRLYRDEIIDGKLPVARKNMVIPPISNTLMMTVTQHGWSDGTRLSNCRVRFRIDPKGIMFDVIGERVDNNEGAEWFVNKFNGPVFRSNINNALETMLDAWAQQRYNLELVADDRAIRQTNK